MQEIFRNILFKCPLLHFLCSSGEVDNIEEFISRKYINYIDYEDETPLIKAIEFKNYHLIPKLIKNGANPYIITNSGHSALSTACSNGDYESTLILLNEGIDPNNNYFTSCIPIICACNTGNIKVVELLLNNNADPNVTDIDGNTALLVSIRNNRYDIIKLLIKYGIIITLYDFYN